MNTPEFEEAVDRALEENPALELVDNSPADPSGDNSFNESADELQRADYASEDDVPAYMMRQNLHDRDYERFDAASVEAADPLSVLDLQLADLDLSDYQRALCSYVIGNLDSNGYLTRSAQSMADDLAMSEAMDVSLKDVQDAIEVVRSLDPAGIGAVDLRDCLALQLDRMSERPGLTAAKTIVREYFNDIALQNIKRITEGMGLSVAQVDLAFDLIKTLNPRPAAAMEAVTSNDRLRQIVPDFIIDSDPDGTVTASLAGGNPDLRIDASFNIENADRASMAFIRERRDSAADFIDLARLRAKTLMAVMTTIIALQPRYFTTFDKADLRPMVLRDVAKATGLDISTISRAINMKYALTPFGTIALKSLFNEGVGSDGDLSAHNIRKAIRRLVDNEDPTAPLSDTAIADALEKDGMSIARRTVAKYRELEGIPSTHYRKRKL